MVRHKLPKLAFAGSNPVTRSILNYYNVCYMQALICIRSKGFEPMRWNSVKKTVLWTVFRNSPDRACEGGVGLRSNPESRHPLHIERKRLPSGGRFFVLGAWLGPPPGHRSAARVGKAPHGPCPTLVRCAASCFHFALPGVVRGFARGFASRFPRTTPGTALLMAFRVPRRGTRPGAGHIESRRRQTPSGHCRGWRDSNLRQSW